MKTMTFENFRQYCIGKKIEQVIYHTDNNERIKGIDTADMHDPMITALSFEQIRFIHIPPQPPQIILKSSTGTICFVGVKHILVNESHAWTEAHIVCEYKGGEKAYALLIDYTPDK